MNNKVAGLIAGSLVAVATGFFLHNHNLSTPILPLQNNNLAESETVTPITPQQIPSVQMKTEDNKTDAIIEVSIELRRDFGAIIDNAKIQVRVLEKMIKALQELYGDQWQEHMEELIRLTFPELADLLLPRLTNLIAYNEWALEQRFEMANMSDQERRQYMWDKRIALFGEDAQIIWQGQLRSERVQDTLMELGKNTDMPLEQKIDVYISQLNEIYQADAAKTISQHSQEVVDHFLTVAAVQDDLNKMPEADRRQQLKKLRKAVGMDDAALARWDTLDNERDKRWNTGREYQKRRNDLQAKYQGEELDKQVQKLQQTIFGEEAEIIRNEEVSGYYRYDGQQQYGLN